MSPSFHSGPLSWVAPKMALRAPAGQDWGAGWPGLPERPWLAWIRGLARIGGLAGPDWGAGLGGWFPGWAEDRSGSGAQHPPRSWRTHAHQHGRPALERVQKSVQDQLGRGFGRWFGGCVASGLDCAGAGP